LTVCGATWSTWKPAALSCAAVRLASSGSETYPAAVSWVIVAASNIETPPTDRGETWA